MSDNSFWIRLWLLIACTLLILVGMLLYACQTEDIRMRQMGYIYKVVPTEYGSRWVLP